MDLSNTSTVPGDLPQTRSQSVGGDDSELTTNTMTRFTWSSGVGRPALVQRFEQLQRVEYPAHPDVVGHAAVHEVDIGTLGAVQIEFALLQLAQRARRGPRRIRATW